MATPLSSHDDWFRSPPPRDVESGGPGRRQSASFVRGVSLSGVLQMLHLERKTCVLEVVSEGHFGALTLVNGELVDAGADELEGEEAVYRILTWPHPQTTILDGVNLFRHTVGLPISRLLMELVRRQDELEVPEFRELPAAGSGGAPSPSTAERFDDWDRLVETLVINGALAAAVLSAEDGRLLALADEFGGTIDGLSATALTELIPTTAGLRDWLLLASGEADDLVVRLNGLQLTIHPLDLKRGHFVYALIESTETLDLIRGACRMAAQS